MKRIYILRHAKSAWASPGSGDIDRPLNARGEHQANLLQNWFSSCEQRPNAIVCSPSRRTLETYEGIKSALTDSSFSIDDKLFHGALEDYLQAIWSLDDSHGAAMIIGHNPTCDELTRYLAIPSSSAYERLMANHFGTANLAVLDADLASWSEIGSASCSVEAVIRPKDLE